MLVGSAGSQGALGADAAEPGGGPRPGVVSMGAGTKILDASQEPR